MNLHYLPPIFAIAIYFNTIFADFAYDDTRAILTNPDITTESPLVNLLKNDFWGTELTHSGSHKSFRPLTSLSFRLNHQLFGLAPLSYHIVNVLLHALITQLFTGFSLQVLKTKTSSLYSGLLFSVHPIHSEAVAGVVGRADLLSALFFLLALSSYVSSLESINKVNWKVLLFAGLSVFCKEIGISVLFIIFFYEVIFVQGVKRESSKVLFATFLLLSLRTHFTGLSLPTFASADNPIAAESHWLTRTLSFLHLPFVNFSLLLLPSTLCFDWSMNSLSLITSLYDSRNIASLVFFALSALFLCFSIKDSRSCLIFLLLSLSYLPFSNLFFYVGFVLAERVLYIPSMGFCLLIPLGLSKLKGRLFISTRIERSLMMVVIVFGALKTFHRSLDWMTEERLYRSGLTVNPSKAYGNLGYVLSQKGQMIQAEFAFKKALEFRYNMADVHYNLGVLYQKQNKLEDALFCYKKAILFRPRLALAHLNYASTLWTLGHKEKAMEVLIHIETLEDEGLRDPRSHKSTQVTALVNLGRLYLELHQPEKALESLIKALKNGKNYNRVGIHGLYIVLGEAYQMLNQTKDAEMYYRAALHTKPNHIPAYLTYGKLLALNKSRRLEAENFFSSASKLAPYDASVALHFGLFLLDDERNMEAGLQFQKAAQLRPNDFESNFNAAVAFRQAGKFELAENFYRQAVALQPNDSSSHRNLGAMLHLMGKFNEAEFHYSKALELKPDDSSTQINMERLRRIQNNSKLKN